MLTVEWIEAFLSNKSQIVVLDGTSSDSVPVTPGVPQGSVLGPALFLLYINDLPDTIDSQVRLFADDTVLYRTIKSDTDHHRLQTDLDKLSDWAMAWGMQFHPDKCLRTYPRNVILQSSLFTPQHRCENDRHRKIPGYYHQSTYEMDKTHNTNLFTCQQSTWIHQSKEVSKYDPIALRRNCSTAWFARMSNMLLQYGPLMR